MGGAAAGRGCCVGGASAWAGLLCGRGFRVGGAVCGRGCCMDGVVIWEGLLVARAAVGASGGAPMEGCLRPGYPCSAGFSARVLPPPLALAAPADGSPWPIWGLRGSLAWVRPGKAASHSLRWGVRLLNIPETRGCGIPVSCEAAGGASRPRAPAPALTPCGPLPASPNSLQTRRPRTPMDVLLWAFCPGLLPTRLPLWGAESTLLLTGGCGVAGEDPGVLLAWPWGWRRFRPARPWQRLGLCVSGGRAQSSAGGILTPL